MKYFIKSKNLKYFLNLCGHCTIVEDKDDASCWDDADYKSLWYFLHELRASTGQKWEVVNSYDEEQEETEAARTFLITKLGTFENVEKEEVLEPEILEKLPESNQGVYCAKIIINGEMRYIPIIRIDNKYYRFKRSLKTIEPCVSSLLDS